MMKKRLIWLFIFMLVFPYGSIASSQIDAEAAAQLLRGEGGAESEMFTDRWNVVPAWSSPPEIDGRMDEPFWAGAALLSDFRTAYFNAKVEGSPAYRVAYDEANLYIGGSFTLEERDVLERIEIVVSPQAAGELHYVLSLPVAASVRRINADWNPSPTGSKENPQKVVVSLDSIDYATSQSGGMFTVEAAIPLSSFGSAGVSPGEEWRMNIVHLHQLNTLPLTAWHPIRTVNFTDTGGTVSVRGHFVDEGRLGSIYFGSVPEGEAWIPTEPELVYTGFMTKRLSFKRMNLNPVHTQYELYWKVPNGPWQQLQQVEVNAVAGERTELAFTHPSPLQDGLYQLKILAKRGEADSKVAVFSFDRDQMIAAGIAAAAVSPPAGPIEQVELTAPSAEVQRILELIPDKVGFRFTGLPEMPELHPDRLFELSPDGKSLISLKTNTVYPNEQFPEDQVKTAVNRLGETVEYPYYEDEDGKQYFLSGHLWYLQKDYTLDQTKAIANTDPLGAARLLYRFAQVYEGYVPTTDYIWYNHPLNINSGPPHNYWGGMWYRWSVADLSSLRPILQAYEQVKKTDALQVLSQEVGEDVEKRLVERLLLPSMDYVLGFPKRLGNMNPPQWLGMIDAGKVMQEPDYIHMAVEWINNYVETQYLSDGFWREVTVSYHNQSTNGFNNAINSLQGYSDPPDYISPRTGQHFDNLDLQNDYPIVGKAMDIPNRLVYPDGKVLPVQDTWANAQSSTPQLNAGSFLLPAAGIGRLTQGLGPSQSQVYLGFVPKYGHNHFDPLNLTLYAQGQELLPDLGYTYTKYRYFATSAMGHNTVVVNSKNMSVNNASRHGGSIEVFAPAGPFQAMRAEQANAYAETELYSREPWFISYPGETGGEGYVLDLFRVSGGKRHEYTLNGDANRDALFETDLNLESYGPYLLPPGTEVVEADDSTESGTAEGHYPGYIYVQDVQQAELTGDRYEVTLKTSVDGEPGAEMKITGLLEEGQNELFLARSPSIRPTRFAGRAGDTNDQAVLYDMPKLVLRRDGSQLQSTFITALEPYAASSGPRIESIERMHPTQAPEGAVALKVTYGDVTDIVLSNPFHSDQPFVVEDITLVGEMGFLRMEDEEVLNMHLVGGTSLQKGSLEVSGSGTVTGTITETMLQVNGDAYDAIVTDTVIPEDVAGSLHGNYVVVTHPDGATRGFKIDEILLEDGKTVIVLEEYDPGFQIYADGTSEMTFFPAKQWNGTHTFTIKNVDGN